MRWIVRFHNKQRFQELALAGVVSALGVSTVVGCGDNTEFGKHKYGSKLQLPAAYCEDMKDKTKRSPPVSSPSWIRRTLATLRIMPLPVPRLIVKGDQAFCMERRALKKRQEDEIAMQELVAGALQARERDPHKLKALNDRALELAYGEGMTLEKREEFVQVRESNSTGLKYFGRDLRKNLILYTTRAIGALKCLRSDTAALDTPTPCLTKLYS